MRRLQSRDDIPAARRIVVKVGSSSISGENAGRITALVDALAATHGRGTEVVLVSSGAIATGMPFLGQEGRPADLATQQAAAAVGQNQLVQRYQESFDRFHIVAGQVLLTASDLGNTTHRRNAKRAILKLLELRILPVVNENDTVATHEIRFGDNDRLAALVAALVEAELLLLLSDVDALYTRPPDEPGAARVPHVEWGDPLADVVAGETHTGVGTGGAITKLAAARAATSAGTAVLLTASTAVADALAGAPVGTWFDPAPEGTEPQLGTPFARSSPVGGRQPSRVR